MRFKLLNYSITIEKEEKWIYTPEETLEYLDAYFRFKPTEKQLKYILDNNILLSYSATCKYIKSVTNRKIAYLPK